MSEAAVLSSKEEMMALAVAREQEEMKMKEGPAEVVRWEKFLPRMVLRVLLVEADDSTRQIIAALLRKCSYRVAAVPDGLMAWETLKGRPHNIDIILTEVELPSISGYALLTLVMEHDICKNIPVIMMSSHDSISMVLKCMLKGAADFLIKPVRRNELRNLWQHVWRRQNLTAGNATQNSHKVEVTSGNNAASNHSSDCATPSHKNKICSDKGSDAHSSCTTPNGEGEAGDGCVQILPGFSQLAKRNASNLRHTDRENCEEYANSVNKLFTPEESSDSLEPMSRRVKASDSMALRWGNEHASAKTSILGGIRRVESLTGDSKVPHGYDNLVVEPSGRAIDLIGTFDNGPKYTHGSSTLYDDPRTIKFTPQLELSLRRFQPSVLKRQGVEETHPLNHSNASAFSWYNGKALQPLLQTSTSNCNGLKEDINKSPEVPATARWIKVNSGWQGHDAISSINQESLTTLVISQSGQTELTCSSPKSGLVRVPAATLDNSGSGYGHVVPSVYYAKPRMPQAWSPNLANQREQSPFTSSISIRSNCETYNSEQNNIQSDETANNYIDQTVHQKDNIEPAEEQRHGSLATGQSASSSVCNGVSNPNHSSASGNFCRRNDGNATSAVTAEQPQGPESSNDGGFLIHDRFRGIDSQCSSQREAALAKFRLKRKDRCYEKKVRYQSRKKLAEQRPRVKGQFVRQVQNDAPVADANV